MQIDALPTFKKTNRKVPGGAQPRAPEHRAHIKPLTSCPLPAVPLQPALLKAKITNQPLISLNWLLHATTLLVK